VSATVSDLEDRPILSWTRYEKMHGPYHVRKQLRLFVEGGMNQSYRVKKKPPFVEERNVSPNGPSEMGRLWYAPV